MIARSFAQRVRAIVALELSGLAPGFDQVVDAGDLQRLFTLLAFKQVFPPGGRTPFQADSGFL